MPGCAVRVATSVNHAMKVPSSGATTAGPSCPAINVGDMAESVDELGEGEARGGVGVE